MSKKIKSVPPDDPMFYGGIGVGAPLTAFLSSKAKAKLKPESEPETTGESNELPDPNRDDEQWPPWDAIGDGDPMERLHLCCETVIRKKRTINDRRRTERAG